ncbi:hypothetical protein COCMIDRAFT_26322 [Bipolaris oryzae ATCC 44560]|uniref:Uncharacterized protein n=1 Tax=Bipolaris oryzae ATCC 44560 TaxID=930090 RepID=W6ZPF1_COCMI|nr:uncharacterized protein COCMIDRAFT_26322 [Bipolaris oryzae ATCC 44560]EUC45491.1 hypothetical protein COCMIDRAFT_26322 [Bipolaris oryzae ATCC 44560]
MATVAVAPQTPSSPKVRIRSQSFDSPFLRISVTPVEESSFSKSTGALETLAGYDDMEESVAAGVFRSASTLPLLKTKMSDESMLSEALSASSSSVTTSPTSTESSMESDDEDDESIASDEEEEDDEEHREQHHHYQHQRPHPLTFAQSTTTNNTTSKDKDKDTTPSPLSPFLYQDTSCPMYSPWLVCAVLDMHDVHRLDWTSIADPIERVWGVRTSSADVLGILSDNGRVMRRRWWD